MKLPLRIKAELEWTSSCVASIKLALVDADDKEFATKYASPDRLYAEIQKILDHKAYIENLDKVLNEAKKKYNIE